MMASQAILVSAAWDYADTSNPKTVGKYAALNLFLNRRKDLAVNYQDGPVSDLYVPIWDVHYDHNQHPYFKKIVGFMTAYVYWQVYFHDILPKGTKKVVAVLGNSCGQQYTYTITGEEAFYMGQGALYDAKYKDMQVTTGFHAFWGGSGDPAKYADGNGGQCIYRVDLYPSQEMEDYYNTSEPLYFAIILASTFLITSVVFVVYDHAVERRNRIVMKQAVQSTEVVNTLYPAAVRERMFEEGGGLADQKSANMADGTLDPDDHQRNKNDCIADQYQSATILFADLAGFTQWSSQREPKDVFHLLETLYGAVSY